MSARCFPTCILILGSTTRCPKLQVFNTTFRPYNQGAHQIVWQTWLSSVLINLHQVRNFILTLRSLSAVPFGRHRDAIVPWASINVLSGQPNFIIFRLSLDYILVFICNEDQHIVNHEKVMSNCASHTLQRNHNYNCKQSKQTEPTPKFIEHKHTRVQITCVTGANSTAGPFCQLGQEPIVSWVMFSPKPTRNFFLFNSAFRLSSSLFLFFLGEFPLVNAFPARQLALLCNSISNGKT